MEINTLNTILLCIILIVLLAIICIRFRSQITRFIKKNQVLRFITMVLIPFALPFVLSIVISIRADSLDTLLSWIYEGTKINATDAVIMALILVAGANLIGQFRIWCKERQENDIRWENFAAKQAYNSLHTIFKERTLQLRVSYHNGLKQGMLTEADIPYSIFDQIRKITWEFCRTISHITDIPTKDLDSAFIYHYCYNGANNKDKDWRWITGKGLKFSVPLNSFVDKADSTFHHMISNNVSMVFYNNKKDAAAEQRYQYTYKDYNHACRGSIIAAKVAFSSNDDILCEGIIMVTSYGKQFLDRYPDHTENELLQLIMDSIFPCYKQLLAAELAMLYFRHQTETIETEKITPIPKLSGMLLPPQEHGKKKSLKCLISTTKKIWTKEK